MSNPSGQEPTPARVVVAGADPHIARVIEVNMLRQGHTVDRRATAAEVLELVHRHACDMIVLDDRLPDADPRELAKRIRNDSGLEVVLLEDAIKSRPRREARWSVLLHFFCAPFVVDGEEMAGGYVTRIVEAVDAAHARKLAILDAIRDFPANDITVDPRELAWGSEPSVVLTHVKMVAKDRRFHLYAADEESEAAIAPVIELATDMSDEDLDFAFDHDALTFLPRTDDEFEVAWQIEGDQFVVATRMWHCHFDDLEDSLACFQWLLTPYYRTAVEWQGGEPVESWIERWTPDGWEPMTPVMFRDPANKKAWKGDGWQVAYQSQAVRNPGPLGDGWDPPTSEPLQSKVLLDRPMAIEQDWL